MVTDDMQETTANSKQIALLHDKETLLSTENPRLFIFSKWTLREGWDNPNVFQICKLRSSGSETSKLQEVGRGLRLPVNEYMSRVKDGKYYVDFTERDFTDRLVGEINSKLGALTEQESKLSNEMIGHILIDYPHLLEEDVLERLDNKALFKPQGSLQNPVCQRGDHENDKTSDNTMKEIVDIFESDMIMAIEVTI